MREETMVAGLVNNKEILSHPWLIAKLFGPLFYIKILYRALLDKNPHTFLEYLRYTK